MKKKILFSYYLQKLAQMEQELLKTDEHRVALLAIVLVQTSLFRRFPSGCTTQEISFCQPMFAQELFIHLCLNAETNGDNLFSAFDFVQTDAYYPGMWGQPCIEDKEITHFLNEVYPEIQSKKDVDVELYSALLGNMSRDELCEKFIHLGNFRMVNENALVIAEPCEETAMIDAAFARLKKGSILYDMLSFGKCDIYGKSSAYRANLEKIANFSKNR